VLDGDLAAARKYLTEGLAAAEIKHIYYNLGELALEEDELPEARGHFATYLHDAEAIDHKDGIVQGLEGFARLAAAEGQLRRAIRLAGAADALRQKTGSPLSPYWRDELDRRLRPATETLSAAEYEAAWSEGKRMRIEDAIADALELGREVGS
jgi:hypothetical protein